MVSATKFSLEPTPNYNEINKKIWLVYRRLRRLIFIHNLQQYIDEYRFRPGNSGYLEIY